MVHDGSDQIPECKPEDLQMWADESKRICKAMYQIYAERSKHTAAWWAKNCKKDFILTSDKAVKLGLADGVAE
jgi:ATP-dependent protease ClpP protease subunit